MPGRTGTGGRGTRSVALIGAAIIIVAGSIGAGAALEHRPRPPGRALRPRDADLVLVPAGMVQIGDDAAPADERPAFQYRARPLLIDRTPVTVAQFAEFVAQTGYVTDAEHFGSAAVIDHDSGEWRLLSGADWRRPLGPKSPAAGADLPATQVSWRDADAFCRAYGARLPTEFEWERAARLGQTADGHVFRAGDPIELSGRYRANVWEGLFPIGDSGADGYRGASPVGAFGAAPSGLTDMAGNVWEWTSSWYVPYSLPDRQPAGGGGERVQRGGSFLCDPTMCQGFRATARGHSTPDSSLVHVGFRCVVDPARRTPLAGRLWPAKISS